MPLKKNFLLLDDAILEQRQAIKASGQKSHYCFTFVWWCPTSFQVPGLEKGVAESWRWKAAQASPVGQEMPELAVEREMALLLISNACPY